ncbi:MAG: hypothetical protein JO302_02675 [Candidatus Eremiobacteraeota bacterium]|nr:hypothetical protein [Candidatus Eremiobacteraeota bacterium]
MRSRSVVSTLAAAALVAGCAGGGAQGMSPMVPFGNGALSGSGMSPVPGGATVVRVHLPWSAPASVPTPGPRFTPPSQMPLATVNATPFPVPTPAGAAYPTSAYPVQALSIGVNGPTPITQTIALTPSSSACAPSSGGSVCQLTLALYPGTYTATVTLFSSASASPLSAIGSPQTIAFSVSPSGGAAVNLSVGTIPAAVAVVPATPLSGQNVSGGVDLYGAGKHQLVAELIDANGNVIIPTVALSYTIAFTGGPLPLTVTQPLAAQANLFTVSYSGPAAATASGSLRLTANVTGPGVNICVQATGDCSNTVAIDVKQLLAVANSSANSVTLYANPQSPPVATIQNGLVDPQALVFDAAGDLFVASQPSSVSEYAPPYTGLPNTIAVGVNHPQALALDLRGNLFVANGNGSNTVTEYVAPYTGGPSATITNGLEDPVSLGLDSTGDLFVANNAANTVTIYAPPYTGTPTSIANGLNVPNSIAVDARGNLFVSNLDSTPNSVLEYTPPFSASSVPSAWITNGINEQGAIAVNGSSSLFVPNQGANTVTEYGPPFNGVPTTIKGGQSQPVALAVDAVGNLFVANYGNNTVTQYAPPYAGVSWITISNGVSSPQALALSPATNL